MANSSPTISRYERVRQVIRQEPALASRLVRGMTTVISPGGDEEHKFETEVVDTTLALHGRGKDINKTNANEILKEAIKHVDMSAEPNSKTARTSVNGGDARAPRKPKVAPKPSARPGPRPKTAAPAPASVTTVTAPTSRARPAKTAEAADEANVYIAVFSNLVYAYKTLERWDKKPGAKERLNKLGPLVQEVRTLSRN